jgi:hypothetical protein
MKIGTEDKNKVKIMAVLIAVAVLVLGYNFLSTPKSPTPPVASQGQTASADQTKKTGTSVSSLDPTVHFDALRLSQNVTYTGSGRNIFRMEAAALTTIPPMVSGPRTPMHQEVGADAGIKSQTPPPTIPLRFYGFANRPGEPNRIFLVDNGEKFIAKEGDIVERRYKIVHINNQVNSQSVMVEDLLTNYRQSIPLTPAPN